ncbi:MAG: ATP-binding protein [bacterium]
MIRKIIEIDEELCNGCGQCAEACSEGAIQIIEGKAKLIEEKYCDGLGACLGECPTGALKIIEREADEFDAEAVEHYLNEKERLAEGSKMACGCPSTYVQELQGADRCEGEQSTEEYSNRPSALTHWPVQIRLIPAQASFLKNADLLVAADCTTVASANFHGEFLKGRVVMIGCPKFDDPGPYIQKFADIFAQNSIKSITALVMEVPCCQGLPVMIKKGLEIAKKDIAIEKIIITAQGHIIKKEMV